MASGFTLAGQFTGALDNGGETLRLEDAVGEKILEFAYNDAWYPITDGLGFSLVIVDEQANWAAWGDKASWRASGTLQGSPGAADPTAPAVAAIRINEVLAHTDLPEVDTIELYNPAATNANIGGWLLTDDLYNPWKYRLPADAVIPAGGYLSFNANQFGAGSNGFLLSELGEQVFLFSADANTNLTGYAHGFDFGVSPNGVSFGRYVTSQGREHFVLQSRLTLATNNAGPRIGPIVISEIMYHPPSVTNGADNDLDEYIELQNITGTNVPLYCTYTGEPGYGAAALTNTWRLRNAVDYDFPTNLNVIANSRILLVGFNPTNTVQLATFRALYSVPTTVPVYGPWRGKLDNSSETIELKSPDKPDVTPTNVTVPYVMMDKVDYGDGVTWPLGGDGLGNALQRVRLTAYGNDSTNWVAGGTSAGRTNAFNLPPVISLTSPTSGAAYGRLQPISLTATASDPDGSVALVEFRDGGSIIATDNGAPWSFSWTNAPFGTHTLVAHAIDDGGGVSQSAPISITVTSLPPTVELTSPAHGATVTAGASVVVTAAPTDLDGVIVAVDFYANGAPVATVTGAPWSFNWVPGGSGSVSLSAVARDDSGAGSLAATVDVSVQGTLANPVAIPTGSSWRYLDRGIDQGTNWMATGFSDAGWSTGSAKFGFNNGNSGLATVLSYGTNASNKHVTYYFRKTFVISSLAGLTNLFLETLRDDGVAVYINGNPLYRDNLPAGTLAYSQLATNCSDNGTVFQTALLSTNGLILGTNVLAAEVHQSSVSSSDLAFDLRLTLLGVILGPAITSQPLNQQVTQGNNAAFSVTASGSGPLAYQWRLNGTNIAGSTSSTYSIPNAQPVHAGNYSAVVANAAGSVTSRTATLTVTLVAPTPILAEIAPQGAQLLLSWTGGLPPFQVQVKTNLASTAWQNLGGSTTNRSLLIAPSGAGSSYRIVGQ